MIRNRFWMVVLAVGIWTPLAQAGWAEFWQRVQIDFYRNHCWPEPFQAQDRELARAPLIAMTAAGWRLNNTLSDHFFNNTDQSMNQAGEIKVRWIVTQAPPHRRMVYVLRGKSPEETNARIAAVQRVIEKYTPEGQRPEVALTETMPPAGSGDLFDQVDRQFKQSIPAPRLPAMVETTAGN